MPDHIPRYRAACHCKAVQLVVALPAGLDEVTRCNFSLCRMRGAVVAWAWLDSVEIVRGADKLQRYTFNTGVAQHYFCRLCGVYTHHQRRGDPRKYFVNVACLEGVSPFDFTDVPVYNGHEHGKDVTGLRVDPAGHVIYESLNEDRMSKPMVMGAVAYAPRVRQIWQGFKDYFDTQGFAYDYRLCDSYGDLTFALLNGTVDLTWNSPTSFVASQHHGQARDLDVCSLVMRDTDVDVCSTPVARRDMGIHSLVDVKGRTIGFDGTFAPESTLLPLEYTARHDLLEGRDFVRVAIDAPVGSSGGYAPDSTLRRIAAMVAGEVDACWIRLDHWALFQQRDAAASQCESVVAIEPYDHCTFAAVRGREHPLTQEFATRLLAMSYGNPVLKPVFDLEVLTKWVPGRDTGFGALTRASKMFGFPPGITERVK